MEEIGIRDLKRQISAILRRVKEEKALSLLPLMDILWLDSYP